MAMIYSLWCHSLLWHPVLCAGTKKKEQKRGYWHKHAGIYVKVEISQVSKLMNARGPCLTASFCHRCFMTWSQWLWWKGAVCWMSWMAWLVCCGKERKRSQPLAYRQDAYEAMTRAETGANFGKIRLKRSDHSFVWCCYQKCHHL